MADPVAKINKEQILTRVRSLPLALKNHQQQSVANEARWPNCIMQFSIKSQ
jgi:hypothetical protein